MIDMPARTALRSGYILKWPYLWILDAQGDPTDWVLLNGPVVSPSQQEQLADLRWSGYRLAGMSSYGDFPRPQVHDAMDYEAACEVWCHCFRDPERFLLSDIPRALISISDFTDPSAVDVARFRRATDADRVDYVYVCGAERWQRERKNWTLAAQCVPLLSGRLGLRGLIVGVPSEELQSSEHVTFTTPLPRHRLLSIIGAARFLFAPNVLDASPRLIAEALCLDVPVVVNSAILGGWKYVNEHTGAFFSSRDDVVAAVSSCLGRSLTPRAWFSANHGPDRAGARLLDLLRAAEPSISARGPLRPASRWGAPIAGR